MRLAVFLRAANVGGRNAFRPKDVAAALEALDVTSLGAAGTFVVRKARSARAAREAFAEALPVPVDVIAVRLDDVVALVRRDPFAGEDASVQRHVSVLAEAPARAPRFPVDVPPEGPWQVRLIGVDGPFALCLRHEGSKHYPNEVAERALGVRATTRGWATIRQVADAA